MRQVMLWIALSTMLVSCSRTEISSRAETAAPAQGAWRAAIQTRHGWLPFNVEISRDGQAWSATIINGPERIEVADVRMDHAEFVLDFPHYDSQIRAHVADAGEALEGTWTKTRGQDNIASVPFRARLGELPRFDPDASGKLSTEAGARLAGRWRISFADSEDDAVGVLVAETSPDASNLHGTVLTTTGDYRYLSGLAEEGRLRLSCFDGAHAFLFDAEVRADGSLAGTFDSGNWYSVGFEGVRDDAAQLPDMFARTSWNQSADLSKVVFRDLDGHSVHLTDDAFAGRPTLIEVMGTWCPNCNDAAPFLAELHRRYRDRGLQVVSLAFELTDDFDRSATQVRRFRARHGIEFPVLIAGLSDKDRASEFFPVLDKVRSYPTTIFMDADGSVRAIHTGFTGPATGGAYTRMHARFERLIEEMLR